MLRLWGKRSIGFAERIKSVVCSTQLFFNLPLIQLDRQTTEEEFAWQGVQNCFRINLRPDNATPGFCFSSAWIRLPFAFRLICCFLFYLLYGIILISFFHSPWPISKTPPQWLQPKKPNQDRHRKEKLTEDRSNLFSLKSQLIDVTAKRSLHRFTVRRSWRASLNRRAVRLIIPEKSSAIDLIDRQQQKATNTSIRHHFDHKNSPFTLNQPS